jgi:hypothetical protein
MTCEIKLRKKHYHAAGFQAVAESYFFKDKGIE